MQSGKNEGNSGTCFDENTGKEEEENGKFLFSFDQYEIFGQNISKNKENIYRVK